MVNEYTLDQTFTHKTPTHSYQIHWTRIGNPTSPPLIFIHGTPWSHFVWQDLANSLSTRYSIYLYDHPNFGISPAPQRLVDAVDQEKIDLDGSLILRAEASAALIKSWHLTSPPHVVAHDNGGLVSLRLLLEHKWKFSSLCLTDVVALGPFGIPFFKLVAENEDVFSAIPPSLADGLLRSYVKGTSFKRLPVELEDRLCGAPWTSERFRREMVNAHYRDAGVLEHEYARVGESVPTKIIWGKDDAWLSCEIAHKLGKALNAEEVVVVEEAGHLIQYDQPGRLALELGLWLSKNSKNDI